MAEMTPEEIKKTMRKYIWIGLSLMVLTGATVGLSYVELPTHGLNILVGLILAAIKASLVGLIFMHLNHERSLIYKVLAFTTVFVVALFLLTYMSHEDPLIWSGF